MQLTKLAFHMPSQLILIFNSKLMTLNAC